MLDMMAERQSEHASNREPPHMDVSGWHRHASVSRYMSVSVGNEPRAPHTAWKYVGHNHEESGKRRMGRHRVDAMIAEPGSSNRDACVPCERQSGLV